VTAFKKGWRNRGWRVLRTLMHMHEKKKIKHKPQTVPWLRFSRHAGWRAKRIAPSNDGACTETTGTMHLPKTGKNTFNTNGPVAQVG